MAKYEVRGLDCASCAKDLECALGKKPDLKDARAWNIARIGVAAILFVVGTAFNPALHDTPFSWAEWAVLLSAYALVGFPVLRSAARSLIHGRVFNETFLMSIATIGAMAIHQIPEAVGVMLFYSLGEWLQDRAVERSRRSISELMDLRPDSVRILKGGERSLVAPESVKPGDMVEVLPGERVPLDGQVVEGSSFMDSSSLTGESVPRSVAPGDSVLGGFVNDQSRLLIRASAEFGKTAAARILELVEESASRKAPTERFISRFAAVYTPIVVALSAAVALLPPLLIPGASFQDWLYRALSILVISCPCALVISIPLGYFGGIGAAAKRKILVKGGNVLDALARLDTVAFDKTGTLTEGRFLLRGIHSRNGFSDDDLLSWAAAAESHSSHPIARSIREAAGPHGRSASEATELKGRGVRAVVDGRVVLAGNDRLLHEEGIAHEDCDAEGTVAYVAVDGRYAGYLSISDALREGAPAALEALRDLGLRRAVMLTGDDKAVAERVAREAGIDEVHAELLPDAKVGRLEALEADPRKRGFLAFVGDGMNDAPVLMRADIGVAMGGLGSEAALEAADLVIMDDDLGRLPQAVRIARFTRKIVWQNIVLALSVKLAFVSLGALGLSGMWEAVIGDVGVSLLAVLNALRTARMALPGRP